MKDYICDCCKHKFSADDAIWVDVDENDNDYFGSDPYDTYPICPKCNSADISDYFGNDDESDVHLSFKEGTGIKEIIFTCIFLFMLLFLLFYICLFGRII